RSHLWESFATSPAAPRRSPQCSSRWRDRTKDLGRSSEVDRRPSTVASHAAKLPIACQQGLPLMTPLPRLNQRSLTQTIQLAAGDIGPLSGAVELEISLPVVDRLEIVAGALA